MYDESDVLSRMMKDEQREPYILNMVPYQVPACSCGDWMDEWMDGRGWYAQMGGWMGQKEKKNKEKKRKRTDVGGRADQREKEDVKKRGKHRYSTCRRKC